MTFTSPLVALKNAPVGVSNSNVQTRSRSSYTLTTSFEEPDDFNRASASRNPSRSPRDAAACVAVSSARWSDAGAASAFRDANAQNEKNRKPARRLWSMSLLYMRSFNDGEIARNVAASASLQVRRCRARCRCCCRRSRCRFRRRRAWRGADDWERPACRAHRRHRGKACGSPQHRDR